MEEGTVRIKDEKAKDFGAQDYKTKDVTQKR
jgi:hypothetical protein